MSYLRYLLLFLCACGSMAHAKGYAPAVAKNSTGFDIRFASNGTPLANMSNAATGVAVGATVALPLSSSVIIQAAATGAITGASAAGAWGAAFGALGGVALLAAPHMLDMLTKTKHTYNPATNQFMSQNDSLNCPVSASQISPSSYANDSNFVSTFFCTPWANDPKIAEYGWIDSCTAYSWCPLRTLVGRAPYVVAGGPDTASSLAAVLQRMTANAPTQAEVQALVDLNFPPEVSLPNVTGSPRAYLGNTVQMFSPDEKRTIESWAKMDYSQPGKVGVETETVTKIETAGKSTTSVTTNADGTTSTTTTLTPGQSVTTTVTNNGLTKTTVITNPNGSTVTVASPTTEADKPSETCGLPGTPACKIDETGTKPEVSATEYSARLDPLETAQTTHVGKVGGVADKPFFSGWSTLFAAPPLAECTVFELPAFKGASMGSLDPCPVVGGVRSVMAYLWALGGLWLCIGMVNKAV